MRISTLLFILWVALCASSVGHAASQPKPAKSAYLITTGAGFAMSPEEGVRYGMNYKLRKVLNSPLYVVASFENPEDPSKPLETRITVEAGVMEFMIQSPRLSVISHDTRYSVELLLFKDPDHTQLLGTHRQEVLFSVPPQYEAIIEASYQVRIR